MIEKVQVSRGSKVAMHPGIDRELYVAPIVWDVNNKLKEMCEGNGVHILHVFQNSVLDVVVQGIELERYIKKLEEALP
jgi:hypothetical protein